MEPCSERILVVEDDPEAREVVAALLKLRNYQVAVAEGPHQALEACARESFDLVLTDIRMAEMDGLELTRQVRFRFPHTDVILMSAFSTVDTVIEALHLGAADYLIKPFASLELVVTTVERVLERRRLKRELQAARERARTQARLQEARRLESLGILAGGIAHDFNNILVGIAGNAALALMEMEPDDPHRPLLEEIVRAARRAVELTDRMLAYSGRGHFRPHLVELGRFTEEMSPLLRSGLPGGARLVLVHEGEPVHVMADTRQLGQVVTSLVANACEALGEGGGTITVRTGHCRLRHGDLEEGALAGALREGKYASLEVVDEGSGMDEETRQRIFDPYFTTRSGGRGLGLPACLGIVRGHRGGIRVWSEPGRGTRVQVLLPSVEASAAEDAGPPAPTVETAGGTLLVVDDEDMVRHLMRRVLEKFGYRVLEASGGEEAVDLFRRRTGEIDAVLLDLTMPGMSGAEVFRAVRSIRPSVPVVVCSGYDQQEVSVSLAEHVPDGFLRKPFEPVALVDMVRSALCRCA